MSSSESSGSEEDVEQEMRCLKLEALEKGRHTDFTFLVGPDKDDAVVSHQTARCFQVKLKSNISSQLVHCLKGDLLMSSEYFEGLIRSGDPCPVHVRHIQPHIFKMLIR